MMFWDHNNNWGWGSWLGMSLVMLVFWGAVIGLIVMLLRTASQPGTTSVQHAEDLLAERLARGEIDDSEYQHRLSVLRHESGANKPHVHRPRLHMAGGGR